MKFLSRILVVLCSCLLFAFPALAAPQDQYKLPEPYMSLEQNYLEAFPGLQKVMDMMIEKTAQQIKKPDQDILHNRVCSALVYKMAVDNKLSAKYQKLAIAGDLLHNISKEDKQDVLTDPALLNQADLMVTRLKKAGYFRNSPNFWKDKEIFTQPKIGNNLSLIHHITGALRVGQMLTEIGGFSKKEVELVEVGVLEHSTGYWYFRSSINDVMGSSDAWAIAYPAPENDLAKLIHDADLISQFVPESVVPEGSKWRVLATKRWKAKTTQEEAHIVYYVFKLLYDEAKTDAGKRLAKEKWDQIAPELIKLMGLQPGDNPIAILGVPAIFQK
ncbi:MAG: hypothetical protein GYA36_08815 [Veillonellaceae bacterium]|nr:hypothetical protein [Veillonellaceae bacterium]